MGGESVNSPDDVFLIGGYYGDYNKIIYIEGVK